MDVFLNVEQLKEEIEFLKNAQKRKRQLGALKTSPNCRVQEDDGSNSSPQSYSENVELLMAWVNAVGEFYNIKVNSVVYVSAKTSVHKSFLIKKLHFITFKCYKITNSISSLYRLSGKKNSRNLYLTVFYLTGGKFHSVFLGW